tara:strand:+ start:252 stop:689 length:438 start_codon:yes stop_codon:yes gene_type:complete
MEMDDLPLVAKKYSTYYGTDEQKQSHLLTKVCRQQLGLILEWCNEHGIECFEDTHRHTIVQKNLADRIDEFTMAKNDFFKSVGVNTIDEMNEFSQGWDGLSVSNMNELVIKADRIDDLESGKHAAESSLEEAEAAIDQARSDLNV